MITQILLAVPRYGDALNELKHFLSEQDADIYVFPEGFLTDDTLISALDIIREHNAFVLTGHKNRADGNKQQMLAIDGDKIVGEYTKCILTESERGNGRTPGDRIHCIDTRFGRIGTPICYEIHFPEVSRLMSLEKPLLLVNPIGHGMYHELQFSQWTALARARAIENEVWVVGCSHFDEEIPLAFAYSPDGNQVLERKGEYGAFMLKVDLSDSLKRPIGYHKDRVSKYFTNL